MRRLIVLGSLAALSAVTALTAIPATAKVAGVNGRIAFARYDPALGDTVTYTANPDGTHARPLLPGYASGSPRWSPDGSKVAVLSAAGLPCCTVAAVVVNPDTGRYVVLPMPDPNTLFTACTVWSADGSRLACEGQGQTDPSLNGIYTIRSSDGRGLTRITSNPGGDDLPIDYSPDGKQIAFSRTDPARPASASSALFLVNVDGTGVRQITPWGFSDDDGSWSPDGTKIVFGNLGSLYVVHPNGAGLTKIPLPTGSRSNAFDVGWSPDGTKIVFSLFTATGPGTRQEGIYTANASGTDIQPATNSPTGDSKADWGPTPPTRG